MRGHRFFAAIYDLSLRGMERGGLREMRAALLGEASGRTLELGAGTGLNLDHYTARVSELVLTEPDPFMARRLRQRLAEERGPVEAVEVVECEAEALSFGDSSFETVVSTLCLCTVADPGRAIAEAARVLEPGGRLLVLEHVRSGNERLARWQDRLERPWGLIAGGCHPNRDTVAGLEAAGFAVDGLDHGTIPKATAIMKPSVQGTSRHDGP